MIVIQSWSCVTETETDLGVTRKHFSEFMTVIFCPIQTKAISVRTLS